MKIIAVVQARSASTRLPNKILKRVQNKTILELQLERISRSKLISQFIVATTISDVDIAIENICKQRKYSYYRGDVNDLLARHYYAVKDLNPDAVIKIPSDCPLIDPKIIDKVIAYYIDNVDNYDFVSNLHPPTYPDGNDVEIMPFHILENAFLNAKRDFEREHTTPYIWNHPNLFRIGNVEYEKGDYSHTHRFTLDYIEDFNFIKEVYDELYPHNKNFELKDIMKLLDERQDIKEINEHLNGINWYRHHLNELNLVTNKK